MIDWNNIDKEDFCTALLEATPIPVLVVNPEVKILYFNSAASKLVGSGAEVVIQRSTGEVLHCIHSTEALEGCGYSPFCSDCIIKDSVNQSLTGRKVSRKLHKMELVQKDNAAEIYLLVTTVPLQYSGEQLVMVLLEDVSELRTLRHLIPICSRCKKIRDDQEYWHHVEEYLKDQLDVDFTHSICPECANKLYPEIYKKKGDGDTP
jgi:nitrogen-specific signal transduction histidine kinase